MTTRYRRIVQCARCGAKGAPYRRGMHWSNVNGWDCGQHVSTPVIVNGELFEDDPSKVVGQGRPPSYPLPGAVLRPGFPSDTER